MPALNFQARFAPLLLSGKKRQTIRAVRKHPVIAGDTLFLYTGLRTRKARYLRTVKCRSASWCRIWEWGLEKERNFTTPKALDRFAREDGFKDWPEMREWFRKQHGLPFTGVLIRW